MTWSGRATRFAPALAMLAAGLLAAPPDAGSAPSARGVAPAFPDSAASAEARTRIGVLWGVEPGRLELSWGYVPPVVRTSAAHVTQILGRGTEGWFVAIVTPENGGAGGATTQSIRLRAGVVDTTWTAARSLRAGARLAAEDIAPALTTIWGPPVAAAARVTPAPGWQLRRAIAAGERLIPPAVTPPYLVNPGEPVVVTWVRRDVRIELNGTALGAARLGETVRVRLAGRPEPLSALAVAPGRAVLNGEN